MINQDQVVIQTVKKIKKNKDSRTCLITQQFQMYPNNPPSLVINNYSNPIKIQIRYFHNNIKIRTNNTYNNQSISKIFNLLHNSSNIHNLISHINNIQYKMFLTNNSTHSNQINLINRSNKHLSNNIHKIQFILLNELLFNC